jgi:quercetin dioxygenase-like cupin family protein
MTEKKAVKAYHWDDSPSRELKPGIIQRGFRSDGVLVTYNYLEPGCQGSPHSHPFDQIFMIVQGRVKLHVEDQLFDCPAGTVIRIPAHHVHYVEPPAPEDGMAINVDIFGPVREDYLPIVAYQGDEFSR